MKKRTMILHDSFLNKDFLAGIQITETSSIGGEYRPSFQTEGRKFFELWLHGANNTVYKYRIK